jgi:5-formyltetrahydrofolate cyclo-ligase
MEVHFAKKALRQQVKQVKASYTAPQLEILSGGAVQKLEHLPQFVEAKTVLAYWSMPDEVFTHGLVEKYHTSKVILLPRIQGANLTLHRFAGVQTMLPNPEFGILEPYGDIFDNFQTIDLVIVPGVAFGTNNTRLGRGKGFYDRLLGSTKALKVGLAFHFQVFDSVPCEAHDICLDMVLH